MTQVRWLRPAVVVLATGFGIALIAPVALGSVGDANPHPVGGVVPSVTLTNVQFDPHFSAAPTTVDFGALEVGAGKDLKAFATNDGFISTSVTLVERSPASAGPFSDERYPCVEASLNKPGGTCEFRYFFKPTSAGLFNATFYIKIQWDYQGQQTLIVKMTGCAYEPGGSCTTQPTSTPTSSGTTAHPTPKDVPGGSANASGVGPVANSSTSLPSPLSAADVEVDHTALAADPRSSDGPNMTMLLLFTAGAAAFGTVIGGVLAFRGRWLWSKLRARSVPGGER
jgi:hypothetical protein